MADNRLTLVGEFIDNASPKIKKLRDEVGGEFAKAEGKAEDATRKTSKALNEQIDVAAALRGAYEEGAKSAEDFTDSTEDVKKAQDEAANSGRGFAGSLGNLTSRLSQSALAFGAGYFSAQKFVAVLQDVKKFTVEAIQSAVRHEDVLASAAASGIRNVEAMDKQAEALQRLSGVSSDLILEQIALGRAMGLSEAEAVKFTRASLEASAALRKDFVRVSEELRETLSGTRGELNSWVPGFRDLTEEQLRAGDGAQLLLDKYEGFNRRLGTELPQTIAVAKQSLIDLKRQVGDTSLAFGALFVPGKVSETYAEIDRVTERLKRLEDRIRAIDENPIGGAISQIILRQLERVEIGVSLVERKANQIDAIIAGLGNAASELGEALGISPPPPDDTGWKEFRKTIKETIATLDEFFSKGDEWSQFPWDPNRIRQFLEAGIPEPQRPDIDAGVRPFDLPRQRFIPLRGGFDDRASGVNERAEQAVENLEEALKKEGELAEDRVKYLDEQRAKQEEMRRDLERFGADVVSVFLRASFAAKDFGEGLKAVLQSVLNSLFDQVANSVGKSIGSAIFSFFLPGPTPGPFPTFLPTSTGPGGGQQPDVTPLERRAIEVTVQGPSFEPPVFEAPTYEPPVFTPPTFEVPKPVTPEPSLAFSGGGLGTGTGLSPIVEEIRGMVRELREMQRRAGREDNRGRNLKAVGVPVVLNVNGRTLARTMIPEIELAYSRGQYGGD